MHITTQEGEHSDNFEELQLEQEEIDPQGFVWPQPGPDPQDSYEPDDPAEISIRGVRGYDTATERGANNRGSINLRRIYPYYRAPFANHGNGCGQAAMATLLSYWGKEPFQPAVAEKLYQQNFSKPDILGGLVGTSWERVRDVMGAYQLRALGVNEPRMRISALQGKFEWLTSWIDRGYPVAAIVGNGEMDGEFGAHWVVVVQASKTQVVMGNFPTSNGFRAISWDVFDKAWRAYWLPGVHYAAVVVY